MHIENHRLKARTEKPPSVLIWMGGFAPIGGIETFIADLSQAAAQAGFQVDLLAWDRRSRLLQGIRDAGVRLFCSPWRWGCRWWLPDALMFPLLLWKCRRAPVVVFGKTVSHSMHRLIRRFGRSPGARQRFIYITPYRPAEIWGRITDDAEKEEVAALLGGFDLIICQNEVFAGDLRSLGYEGLLEMLPNLPPPGAEKPAPYPEEGPLTIGFLGRLENQKNLPELLKVFAILHEEAVKAPEGRRAMRLRLIGDGSLRADLMRLARELGIEASVDFLGAVPRERVRAEIRACQLFCFTSHSEGQPIASLEILAEGRPIIATAVGAFPNMLTLPTLGATVPTHDTAAFVAAVRGMIAAQKAGRVNPQASVEAYRTKFDRDAAFRRYLEILSLDGSLPELGRKTPDVSLDPAIG